MTPADALTYLVDEPNESLAIEYKSEFASGNLTSKASLARHVAALANHGGGHIVYGFNDDMTRADQTEFPELNRDSVASIVKSYLDPPFQCDVRLLRSSTGSDHTIIVVPSHGSAPICACRDGPHDTKGKPQGIVSGAYYIRKPGPQSAAISASSEWAPVIRRCALAERAAILGAIDAALKGGKPDEDIALRLRQWHEALAQAYRKRLADAGRANPLPHGYVQLSFALHLSGDTIPHGELLRVIERCNAEADAIIRMHWGPFVVFHRDPISPRSRTTPDIDNGERDFLEAAVIEPGETTDTADMWRISNDGYASIIKGWWEDTRDFGRAPQTCLSPNWFAREIAGFVSFARAFANNFDKATTVTFRCEWTGLRGRKPFEHSALWRGHAAEDERRISAETVSVAELNSGWAAASAALAGPVARAVGLDHLLVSEWFANQGKAWARQN